MGDGGSAVVVELLVVMGPHVAAGEALFEVLEEGRVHGHEVFEVSVLGAVLDHEDLAVALDDLSLDLADFFIEQHFVGQLAVQNLLANLGDALGAKRIGGARPAEGGLFLLPGLEQWFLTPLGNEPGVGADAVQALKHHPRALRGVNGSFLGILDCFWHRVQLSSNGRLPAIEPRRGPDFNLLTEN